MCSTVITCLLAAAPTVAQSGRSEQEPTWLWVIDQHTELGIADASVEIGPGTACLGVGKFGDGKWVARYMTGPAGRVLIHGLSSEFSCRLTLNGRQLLVVSVGSGEIRPWTGPKWAHSEKARQTTILVDTENRDVESVELDYWNTTQDPTLCPNS